MSQGAWVVVVVLVAATLFAVYRAATDGRFRGTHQVRGGAEGRPGDDRPGDDRPDIDRPGAVPEGTSPTVSVLAGEELADQVGERATLLQFSSAFCAPCRATRRILGDVAEVVPGVAHVEVDAEHHLELVRRLGVLRTPTTLVLDAHGREVTRATGTPRKEMVLAALAKAVPDTPAAG